MRILVTGSAGFIGGAFVRMLLGKSLQPAKDFPVLGAQDFLLSLDLLTYAADRDNLNAVAKEPRHLFVQGDIGDRALVERLITENRLDGIINFAAESHVDRSIDGSEVFARTNVMGTLNLLEAARRFGLRYLQVSTDEVYGALGDEGSFREDTPLAPNSPYSASKAAADCFVRAYFETHKVPTLITRCSNNYGPRMFPEKFLPLAMTRLMAGKKIPVYGQGLQVRDWLHVEDHAAGVWLAYTRGTPGEVYNFGGFGEERNIDMARKLARLWCADPDAALEFVTDRKGHDFRYSMDSSKAQRELGWRTRWELDEGLTHMAQWYRDNRAWWEPKLA